MFVCVLSFYFAAFDCFSTPTKRLYESEKLIIREYLGATCHIDTKMNTVPKGKMDSTSEESSSRNRSELLLGQLPDNFLRIDNMDHQIENDQELAASLQKQYDQQAAASGNQWATQFKAQLVLTFVEARLVKNYGLMNMNPYLRLRVGHTIYETKTRFVCTVCSSNFLLLFLLIFQ